MATFVGLWATTRYTGNDPENPETIQLSIAEDQDPANLDGAYARPGPDARMFGAIEGGGTMWRATIDEGASTGDEGTAVFLLSTDGNTLHGAWTSQQHASGPQPWYGTRV